MEYADLQNGYLMCILLHLPYPFFQGYTESYPKFYNYLGTRFIWPIYKPVMST
uniref:Uncharacterized protein n=1 Tax=Rhizophora mucronata TaxID=61149 RepID=A0A2P2MU79_RHIMU